MFRANANPFDDVLAKATDENLTSENWEFIMEAVDKVQESGETGPRDVVAALIKRLAHRNAQVQIYTLETANALSQNCGVKIHREISSRAFTDSLLRLAGDRNTHQAVKSKILERMEDWAEMFSKDSELGIMEQAYLRLKSQNPTLHAPSKPTKSAITDMDRQREDDDLARALEISLQDSRRGGPSSSSQAASGAAAAAASSSTAPTQPSQKAQEKKAEPAAAPVDATAATVSRVRALYDFEPTEAGELAFRKGDILAVLESVYKDWWKGSLRGQTGIFPLNYVEKLADPTPEELQKEAETEAEVFAQIKNVEKLLSMLSTSSSDQHVQDNEEITTLYHQTLAIRPKLIDLISKYQQRRDDFVALNEKFVKARRDYEALLDTSMSHPPAPNYPRPYSYGGPEPYNVPPPAGSGPGGYYPGAGGPQHTSPPPQNAPYGQPHDQGTPYPTGPPAGAVPGAPYGGYPGGPQGGPQGAPANPSPAAGVAGRPRVSSAGPHDGQPPQELATSTFDSPTDNRPNYDLAAAGAQGAPGQPGSQAQAQPPQQQPSQPPGSGGAGAQQPATSAYQSYYSKYQAPQQQGGPPAGGPPGAQDGQYPVIRTTSPTTLRSSTDSYQQYLNNRPQSWHDPNQPQPGQQGGQPSGGNPADYYRNETFLPHGTHH